PEPCSGYLESGLSDTSSQQQDDSDEEMDRQIDEALYDSPQDQFFSAPGGSSSQGEH
ncbi:hypothetical protein A2U01_0086469, partial [Trifolium medium]|nr:hypothetical protein [Trifolium medium]